MKKLFKRKGKNRVNYIKLKNKKNRNKKKKLFFRILFILLYILCSLIIAYFYIFVKKNKNKNRNNNKNKNIIAVKTNSSHQYEIMYKGKWILKSEFFNTILPRVPDEYQFEKNNDLIKLKYCYNLKEYSDDPEIKAELRKEFYTKISERKRYYKNITTFFVSEVGYFGNSLINVNNAIFYCEILGCNKVILNNGPGKRKWLIKNPIYIEKLNITIMQGPKANCNDENILCLSEHLNVFDGVIVKPEVRIQYIKNEILQNLPKVNTNPDDLYIHIRSGDIFRSTPAEIYAQPPLCFYEEIININNFKNIYIIAKDKLNVVIEPLMNKYPQIIFNINYLELDISLLAHAYHVAISISTFALGAVKINDNLINLYEYDIGRASRKIPWLHHHVCKYDIKYKIFTMNPSDEYASKMFCWIKTDEQKKLMLEDKCPYKFERTFPNQ